MNCFEDSAHEAAQLCDVNTVFNLKLRFLLIYFYVFVGGWKEGTLLIILATIDGNTLLYRRWKKSKCIYQHQKKYKEDKIPY